MKAASEIIVGLRVHWIFFGDGPLVLLAASSTPMSFPAGPYQKTAASGGDSPLIFLVLKVHRIRALV